MKVISYMPSRILFTYDKENNEKTAKTYNDPSYGMSVTKNDAVERRIMAGGFISWEDYEKYTFERMTIQFDMSFSVQTPAGKISMIVKKTDETISSEDVENAWNVLENAEVISEFEINQNISQLVGKELTINDKSVVYDVMRYGLIFMTDEQTYGFLHNVTIYAEYDEASAPPTVVIKRDMMNNGRFYEKEDIVTYYPDITEQFVVAWEYIHEANVENVGTELKIKASYYTDYGEKFETEEDVSEYIHYEGTVGTATLPERLWKHIPYRANITIEVTAENGKSATVGLLISQSYYKINAIEPSKDTLLIGNSENILSWSVEQSEEEVELPNISGYRIDVSNDDGVTWNIFAEVATNTRQYTIPGNMLESGIIKIRIYILYSNNTVTGYYGVGETRYVIKINPETSEVTCDGKPLPTISWETPEQCAYQVRFGWYDSGAIFGSEMNHKVPYVFEDGVYECTVRTQSATGKWSEWTEPIYVDVRNEDTLQTMEIGSEKVMFETISGYIERWKVLWTTIANAAGYIVYRNGVPIHVEYGNDNGATKKGYLDKLANGIVVYKVRAIFDTGYYTETAEKKENACINTDIILELGTENIIPLRYTTTFPRQYNYETEANIIYKRFAGRAKPIAVTNNNTNRSIRLIYADKGRELAKEIDKVIGKLVAFMDHCGDGIIGVLGRNDVGFGIVNTTSFNITEVDYNERVPYIPE